MRHVNHAQSLDDGVPAKDLGELLLVAYLGVHLRYFTSILGIELYLSTLTSTYVQSTEGEKILS